MKLRGWGAAVALSALALTGCVSEAERAAEEARKADQLERALGGPAAEQTPASSTIRFEITAEGGVKASERLTVAWVDVTETTSSGTSQSEQRAPYAVSHDLPSGSPAVVLAQAGTDVTSVTCAIYSGSTKLAENTSTGKYAVVSCSGAVP